MLNLLISGCGLCRRIVIFLSVIIVFPVILPSPAHCSENKSERSVTAWDYLRLTDVGPVLAPMVLRTAIALKNSDRTSETWRMEDQKTQLEIDIRLETGAQKEILISFFKSPDWSEPPAHIRPFPGPGKYKINDIPAGEYYLGAAMGMTVDPWPEAGHYLNDMSMRMEGAPPALAGIGVHETWPDPVIVRKDKAAVTAVLLSDKFKWISGEFGSGTLLSGYGRWKVMDPERLVTVRTEDSEGNPVPFCRIVLYTEGSLRNRYFKEFGTDSTGYGYFDQLDTSFTVTAENFISVPSRLMDVYQIVRFEEVYNTSDKPVITVLFDPVIEGPGRISGYIHDQHYEPLQDFFLTMTREKGDRMGTGLYSGTVRHICMSDPEGAYEVGGLPPGDYRMRARAFDYAIYDSSFDMWNFTIPNEGNMKVELELDIEAKELYYGKAVYENGAPVSEARYKAIFGEGHDYHIEKLAPDGSFRVPLSEEEYKKLMKYSEGKIDIETGDNTIYRIKIRQLSKNKDRPARITLPNPDKE